jgi:hypothetical protein
VRLLREGLQVKRAFYVVANVEPYRERQVLVLDDTAEPDAGWIRSGWVSEIVAPAALVPVTPELIERFKAERGAR